MSCTLRRGWDEVADLLVGHRGGVVEHVVGDDVSRVPRLTARCGAAGGRCCRRCSIRGRRPDGRGSASMRPRSAPPAGGPPATALVGTTMLLGVVAVQPFPALVAALPCGVRAAARGPLALRITAPARTRPATTRARMTVTGFIPRVHHPGRTAPPPRRSTHPRRVVPGTPHPGHIGARLPGQPRALVRIVRHPPRHRACARRRRRYRRRLGRHHHSEPADYDLPYSGHRKRCAAELGKAQRTQARRRRPRGHAASNGYKTTTRRAAVLHKKAARQNTHTARIWAKPLSPNTS